MILFSMLSGGKRPCMVLQGGDCHGPSPAQPPGRNAAAVLAFPKASLVFVKCFRPSEEGGGSFLVCLKQ